MRKIGDFKTTGNRFHQKMSKSCRGEAVVQLLPTDGILRGLGTIMEVLSLNADLPLKTVLSLSKFKQNWEVMIQYSDNSEIKMNRSCASS